MKGLIEQDGKKYTIPRVVFDRELLLVESPILEEEMQQAIDGIREQLQAD